MKSYVMLNTGYVFSFEGTLKFDSTDWSIEAKGFLAAPGLDLNANGQIDSYGRWQNGVGKEVVNFSFKRDSAVAYWSD